MDEVEIVRTALAAWSRGDEGAALRFIDPAIEWRTSGAAPDADLVYHGIDGVRRFWELWRQPWERLALETDSLRRVDDNTVLAFIHFEGLGRDGITLARQFGMVFTFRDGLLIKFQSYASWEEALEATGLAR